MDVSIAVSLIRGQMGAVVERAVNGAVETVLAEMLKVVGVKFEELKAQLMLMKREVAALQREKALKEKENDNIRAKLRYTELKLKYYRQGVEEELQQRAATLVYIHPHNFPRTQRGGATEATTSCSAQSSTTEEETVVERSSGVLQEDEWSFSVQPEAERLQMLEDQPDASMLPPSGLQVKQEEVICIKEEEPEPEEEQEEEQEEVTAMMQPAPHPETERTVMDWSRLNQTSPDASYPPPSSSSSSSSPPSVAPPQPGAPPRPASRPWTKDLGLYEDYKLRRNDLRRRNLNRRRELEKTLPQPLLADLLQERREKTRLRVARWRAKRKLQACLNQAQPHGGAAALSLSRLSFPVGLQHQQLRASNQSSASSPSSSVLRNMSASVSAVPPIPPPPSSSSSSSSHPQVSQSQQSISPTHTELHT